MSVNLSHPENILSVAGVRLSAICAGIRKVSKPDVVLIELSERSHLAASLTKNLFCAAPITVVRENLAATQPRYLLINSGNANAGTGERGLRDAKECCRALSSEVGVSEAAVLPFSTGVIGQSLPVNKIKKVLSDLLATLDDKGWLVAAKGIMTTDTVAKAISKIVDTKDGVITITGISKGAGMICPDMATMLSFIATDAEIDQPNLDRLHQRLVGDSFNRISVDGDTSTNDACVFIATGKGNKLSPDSDAWVLFERAALEVYQGLAQAIIRDGEGATKFVTINVVNGNSQLDCETVARTIAHSPLVKTALFASDANWGRILAAVGRAGVAVNINKIGLAINDTDVLKRGQLDENYSEQAGAAAMAEAEIVIKIDLGSGAAQYTLWTTDLSHEYVSINADYRS